MTAPTMLKLDELQLLDAVSRGHVYRAATGAIWYSPRFVRGAAVNTGATKHRVDRAFGKLRSIGLVDLVKEGTCPLTEAGKQVLAIQRAMRAEVAATPAPRPAPPVKPERTSEPVEAQPQRVATDWRHHSVCRSEDPELFFPIGSSGPAVLQIEQAKKVCGRCPVSTECLKWALETGQDAGVWGGMSEEERRAVKTGRPVLTPLPRNCQRCSNPYDVDAVNPHARICPACATDDAVKHRKRHPRVGA